MTSEFLARLGSFETPDDAVSAFHYHGTSEAFDDDLRPSPYDGCLWLADCPTVAQTYIPTTGGKSLLHIHSWRMDDLVRPAVTERGDPFGTYEIAISLGFPSAFAIELDQYGEAKSWRVPPGYPRNRDLVERLVSMGYEAEDGKDFQHWLRTDMRKGKTIVHQKDHRNEGRLFIVDGVSDLRIYDFHTGREGELGDPDYHRLHLFRKLEASGQWDGIAIHDFCQTETHGNVGHKSIGVFAHGLLRLSHVSTPARHWEWPPGERCWRKVTPEFEALHGLSLDAAGPRPR
jgi:hypothetical protein